MTEDEMVGWHHQLNGHGYGWTPRVSNGQGSLACCSPWGHTELDTTERLNNNKEHWTKREGHPFHVSLTALGQLLFGILQT